MKCENCKGRTWKQTESIPRENFVCTDNNKLLSGSPVPKCNQNNEDKIGVSENKLKSKGAETEIVDFLCLTHWPLGMGESQMKGLKR